MGGKNPTDLSTKESLGNMGMSLTISASATSALQLSQSHAIWDIRKGIVSSTPFYSTLFIYRHILCWLVGADSCALASAWSQFNSILRKWPRKKKKGKEGKPQRTQYVLVSWACTEQNGLQKLHFLQVLLRPNNMSCHFVSHIFWPVLPTLSTFAYKTRSLHILKEQGSNFGHWWNINFE